ncbi:maleylpyruvate isomerase family mycothiol-dependent enzyme [Actinomadura bangladeshensis]|uniref:Maleylpyruvate isomerase family mycothiol-dependent enzyme n=1 Tax=Actinomadura bangladeshensis TaxID=453573 RepID=A0A4R4PC48_9ACTN|nr:maleylpyruvate isomerase family mycothiol-dependent enzyme [Actinomadura bangladeshensis]
MDAGRTQEGLREHARGLADAASGADALTRVPTCPDWTLRELVGHVGQAHRWATHLVRTGGTDVLDELPRTPPDSPADWSGWLLDGADELIEAFEANPDGSVEHPLLGTWPTAMWVRRMANETAVHHADAALATGTPFAVAPDLAGDAITEFLGLLTAVTAAAYKPELAELRGNGETLCLRPAEASLEGWLITRTPEGPVWEHGVRDADMTVDGPVRDLLLVFARRLAPADAPGVKVTGDASLLDHWLARTAV